ncbi:phage/plasmid primase, P4 family [Chachezhania antarctica]|uniref:phage/plasmid primase, P4 family n=1 Tax=Chachezhania antarctica TaxID=2340860 RepID=UPI000EB54614|nr:phage/plasmid primase, P4 family [Chachezhania antarctica]
MDGTDDLAGAFARAELIPSQDGGGQDCNPGPEYVEPPEAAAALYPLNDFGNGQRLIKYFGDDILFVPRLGWYRWKGDRWLADEDELTVRGDAQKIASRILIEVNHLALEAWEIARLDLARETSAELRAAERKKPEDLDEAGRRRKSELRTIADEAAEIRKDLGRRKSQHRQHARASGNSAKISNMLLEAKPKVARMIAEINADPYSVNVANGTVKFHFGVDPHEEAWGDARPKWRVELHPHDREDLISKMIPVAYDPAAACPAWLAFLDRVQPDPEVQAFLRRWIGYCLTGKTTEQKLVFNYGGGRNGKSTFVDVLARIFADYGTTVPIETLTGTEQRKGSDATPDLVRLPGARFVRASEPEQGTRMKEALIKALTGGEAIMIRRMMQEFVEVVPEFKLMISGNHKPEIRGSDDGIWRRVLLVPWLVQIPDDEVDPTLADKLWAEAEGILAWAVQGFLEWADQGLAAPAVVREATDEYRLESDKLRLFLQTECEITGLPDDWTASRDLRDGFNAFLLDRGDAAWGSRAVSNAIHDRVGVVKGPNGEQFSSVKRSDVGFCGIRMHEAAMNRIAQYGDGLRSASARKG